MSAIIANGKGTLDKFIGDAIMATWGGLRPANREEDAQNAVLAALETWKQAMIKKDRAAVEKVLHPDLSYGHSDGHLEDKATAIKMK